MILSCSYTVKSDGTHINLYCKRKDGETIIIDEQWNPYCIIDGLTSGHIRTLLGDDRIKKIIQVRQRLRDGTERDMHKVEVHAPKNVEELRGWIKEYMTVYRGDIPYYLNYMYEHDYGLFIKTLNMGKRQAIYKSDKSFVPKLKVISFDIENLLLDEERPIIVISTYNNISRQARSFSIDKGQEKFYPSSAENRLRFKTEKELLSAFIDYIKSEDPDVLLGYNIDEYDWIHISDRCKKLGVPIDIGRDGSKLFIRAKTDKEKNVRHDIKIAGRISWDIWKSVRKHLKPNSEKLDDVAKELGLGEKLEGVDSQHIDDHWTGNPYKVESYCIQDSILSYKIFKNQGYLDMAVSLAEASMLPLSDAVESISSRLIDSVMIREYSKEGYAIPMHRRGFFSKRKEDEDDDEDEKENDKIKGAFIAPMTAGVYKYIGVLDYKSLYPSIIMQYNICWTTLADFDKSTPDEDCYIIEFDDEVKDKRGNVIDIVHKKHRFYKETVKPGILPRILKRLMEQRTEIKKQMFQAKKEGDTKRAKYLDNLQGAVKILMNSFYGIHLTAFYRFSDRSLGESVTAFARETILRTIDKIEEMGYRVVGSDTDSTMIDFKASSLKEAVRLMNNISLELSNKYLVLEPEKVYITFFNHGKKKNYFGNIAWEDGEFLEEPRLFVRGYGVRRRDRFPLLKKYLSRFMDAVINGEDMEQFWRTVVSELQSFMPDPSELVISKTVRDESKYANPNNMPAVKAARKLAAKGIHIFDGMRIDYIVTNGKSPQEVEPVIENEDYPMPDYNYYRDAIIKSLAGSNRNPGISAVFGWDYKSLKSGMKKTSLDDLMGGDDGE